MLGAVGDFCQGQAWFLNGHINRALATVRPSSALVEHGPYPVAPARAAGVPARERTQSCPVPPPNWPVLWTQLLPGLYLIITTAVSGRLLRLSTRPATRTVPDTVAPASGLDDDHARRRRDGRRHRIVHKAVEPGVGRIVEVLGGILDAQAQVRCRLAQRAQERSSLCRPTSAAKAAGWTRK